jgi:hypothetical protein
MPLETIQTCNDRIAAGLGYSASAQTVPPTLDHWRILESGPGPYLIDGTLDGRPFREPVFALTLEGGGLALLKDRRLALGRPGSGGLAIVDEGAVLDRAAAWIRGDIS